VSSEADATTRSVPRIVGLTDHAVVAPVVVAWSLVTPVPPMNDDAQILRSFVVAENVAVMTEPDARPDDASPLMSAERTPPLFASWTFVHVTAAPVFARLESVALALKCETPTKIHAPARQRCGRERDRGRCAARALIRAKAGLINNPSHWPLLLVGVGDDLADPVQRVEQRLDASVQGGDLVVARRLARRRVRCRRGLRVGVAVGVGVA
jgi:hypothetical protein